MGGLKLKVAVLTSSRADYSIYFPLLKQLKADDYFELEIIAFGTHLSEQHGATYKAIEKDGFEVKHKIENLLKGDHPKDISESQGATMIAFADFWSEHTFDLVFCLGDRFEMFSAVSAGVPFNVKFAHIHGGETTLGAIDNVYRHSISLMSKFHFVTCKAYNDKLKSLLGKDQKIFNVGALSIDNLKNLKLYSKPKMIELFGLDLNKPSILFTFHPETVSFEKNEVYIQEIIKAFQLLKEYQLVITMPNADTMGNLIRCYLEKYFAEVKNVFAIENFGTLGYLSAMKHCKMMLGNTSSGFVEASYFPTPVVNLGSRQDGRLRNRHIFDVEIKKASIVQKVREISQGTHLLNENSYGAGDTAVTICKILKEIH